MPLKDAGPFVAQALASVLTQTFTDLEVIVVDDGSRDGSSGVVQASAISDSRVHRVNANGVGIVDALNQGLALAKGRLVGRMDADDVSHPERLDRQADLLENPQVALVGCGFEVLDQYGTALGRIVPPLDDADIRRRALVRNPFAGGSILARTAEVRGAGGFGCVQRAAEDYELVWRMAARGWLAAPRGLLYGWRFHAGNTTRHSRASEATEVENLLYPLWAKHPPVRNARDLRQRVSRYRPYNGWDEPKYATDVRVAQLIETEILVSRRMFTIGRRADAARQLAAVAATGGSLRPVLADLPHRWRQHRRHRGSRSRRDAFAEDV